MRSLVPERGAALLGDALAAQAKHGAAGRDRNTDRRLRLGAPRLQLARVFEATQSTRAAYMFQRLCEDPELEVVQQPFPWTGIREKAKPAP